MTATFGKLQGRSLELGDGLNIIEAPNETGKSTWCAFLLSILYGVNSRERDRAGFIADKNRFAPWSGAAMSGRMDCGTELGELTLTRATRRQTSPMGEFSAVYAGTNEPVPGLTGAACGETLLGISREVFERSAFIRQNNLPISQDAELERRIAALISSGEEGTSYTEAADALKKQLNRRRHNRTGQLPALETELAELDRQLSESNSLARQLVQARSEVEALSRRAEILQAELTDCDRWEAAQRRQALSGAASAAEQAEVRAAQVQERLQQDQIPENETIARLRGAIVNLETTRRAVDKARSERDEAMKALLRAEAAVNESPFAGQSPESARREAAGTENEPVKWNPVPGVLTFLIGVPLCFVVTYAVLFLTGSHSKLLALLTMLAGFSCVCALALFLKKRAFQAGWAELRLKRFGTADLDAIRQLAEDYAKLCEARDAAQASVNAKSAAADTLYSSLSSNEQGILLEVRRFAPDAFDIPTADQLLRACAVRRKELAEAETAAREARMRYELQVQQAPAPGTPQDEGYGFPTLPCPENGYTYEKATEDYSLPLTVYRPFFAMPVSVWGRAEEELTLPVVVRHPAAEASQKELNGRIYNEAVEVKDYAVAGVKAQTLVTAEEMPEGAVYLEEEKEIRWTPRADQKGEFLIRLRADDGVLPEYGTIKVFIE